MSNDSQRLYKKYKDVCLDPTQYTFLEKRRAISTNIKHIYGTNYKLRYITFGKEGDFIYYVPSRIAASGANVFLENWKGKRWDKDTPEAMLIFYDFLVIFDRPYMHPFDDEANFKYDYVADPVVIPISAIESVSYKIGNDNDYINDCYIKIVFKNESSFNAIFQTTYNLENGHTFITGENWSFNTNQIISGGLSHKRGHEKANLLIIVNRIEQLRKNCSNYEDRENAILNIDCSDKTRKILMDNLYSSIQTFATCLIDHQSDLNQHSQNKNVIDKIENFNKTQKELSSQRNSLNTELESLNQAKNDKTKILEETGFIKKFSIRKEISILNAKIKELEFELENLELPFSLYRDIIDAFLTESSKKEKEYQSLELAKSLYLECQKRNLDEIKTEEEKMLYNMICDSLDIPKSKQTEKFFNLGRDAILQKPVSESKEQRKLRLLNRTAEETAYESAKEKSSIVGKEKYLAKYNPNSWFDSWNKERFDQLSQKICDTKHSQMFFEYLECSVGSYSINDTGTMSLNIKVDYVKPEKFNNMDISIDGSLLVEIKANEELVGTAYLCAPGFNTLNVNHVGFKQQSEYNIIGMPISSFSQDINYSFKIKPLNIWMIEK